MPKLDNSIDRVAAFKKAEKTTPDRFANVLILLGAVAAAALMLFVFFSMVMTDNAAAQGTGILGIVGVLVTFWHVLTKPGSVQTVETIIGHDLNHDGYVGAPPSTQIEFHATERTTWMAELPAPPELIMEWAQAAIRGQSLGYRQWQRRFALRPDGSDGAQRYADFRDALVRGQLAVEGGKSGIRLTDRGIQQFMEYTAQRPEATPLLDG